MKPQHLSDEAVAAYADGVLTGHARERAKRHTAECPECAHSVAVQREAVWALRAAPAPSLPSGLFDRLLDVPVTTPIRVVPTAIAEDGSTMFSTFGSMASVGTVGVAAVVPVRPQPPAGKQPRGHRLGPIAGTAAAVVVAGALIVSSAGHATGSERPNVPNHPGNVVPANVQPAGYVVAR